MSFIPNLAAAGNYELEKALKDIDTRLTRLEGNFKLTSESPSISPSLSPSLSPSKSPSLSPSISPST